MTSTSTITIARRTLRALLLGFLASAALAAGSAQPASADTTATFTNGTGVQICDTVWQYGTLYQWGAWGRYIDGCTASVTCPFADGCVFERAFGSLRHSTEQSTQRSTCNSRLRIFTSSGSLRYSQDRSASGYAWCNDTHTDVALPFLWYGERATVQTNGVRNDIPGYARITSWVGLISWNDRCYYYTRVYGC
jgi:hypothetical protein